jgi:hypothetical protein
MRVRTLREAARFVDRAGFAYVFPDNKVPLPSLWGAVQGNPLRQMEPDEWDFTKPVARAWDLKDALGEKRRAWYGRLIRGKATLVSLEMLPPLFRLVGNREGRGLSPEARELCERLRNVGPMSTLRLRMSLRLSGSRGAARFEKVLLGLYRGLLIANVGIDGTETRWPAGVVGLFRECFPGVARAAARLSREEALRRVLSRLPAMSPARARLLFGSGVC